MAVFDFLYPAKPFPISAASGIVSFTFDDFPRSALARGGDILGRHGSAGTYYVAGRLTGEYENGQPCHSEADIALALRDGHEIGSHGYAHIRYAGLSAEQIEADLAGNERFLAGILPAPPLSFAYPFGARSTRAKSVLAERLGTARGISAGVNAGVCDLADLRANRIYADTTEHQLGALIEHAASTRSWLIFYTHDVSETPTRWGTTPALFEFAVKESIASGCRPLPIRKAFDAILRESMVIPRNGKSMGGRQTVKSPSSGADDSDPVVIAIVGYKNAGDIFQCLAALTRSTHKNFAISICENGGEAACAALIEALAGLVQFDDSPPANIDDRVDGARAGRLRAGGQPVRIYRARDNIGFAAGINVCIREIGPEPWSALWMLNPDTEPEPEALASLIECARKGSYGIVGSRLVLKATDRIQMYGDRWRPLMARGLNIGMNEPADAVPDGEGIAHSINYVSGASLFATRGCVESIGLMDERYFLYCEEVDWCFRRGYQRLGYAHNAVVYHSHGTTTGWSTSRKDRSSLSVYLDERNKLLFSRRFYPGIYPLILVITCVLTAQYLAHGSVAAN